MSRLRLPRPSTLRMRIILTVTVLTAALVFLLARLAYVTARDTYLRQISDHTTTLAGALGRGIDRTYLGYLPGPLAETDLRIQLSDMADTWQLPEVMVFDDRYRVLVHQSDSLESGQRDHRLLPYAGDLVALDSGEALATLPFRAGDRWFLWGFYRLDATRWLGIRESAARLERIESLAGQFVAIGLLGVLLTALAGWLIARGLSRPVERLVAFSRTVGRGDFSARAPEAVHGELAVLAEALERMRDDLARHQQEKETMLAQIAHEIRNPLGGMELLAGLLCEDLQSGGLDTRYADTILQEVRGLKALISAYLNYSRPTPARPETLVFGDAVDEVLALGDEGSDAVAVSGRETVLRFDPHHLRQILHNLLANARAAGGAGPIDLSARHRGESIEITVSDRGPGVAEADLPHLFDPFFTTRADGTGLGLAVCAKLCRENGAAIAISNRSGGGCRVTIRLPAETDGGNGASPDPAEAVPQPAPAREEA